MKNSQFARPIYLNDGGDLEILKRLDINKASSTYNEAWIRDLLFSKPNCLPIEEIDRAFSPLIPICKELHTPSGYIDSLYVTPHGRIVVLEAKLWRNPEARRKVVGQILDYAKDLKKWSFADLQREVSKSLKEKGNALHRLACSLNDTTLPEAEFSDEITRNLRNGRFLLLIAGDGIREEANAIAEFLMNTGTMLFTLALVEVAIFSRGNDFLVQPRILAKTEIVNRIVTEIKTIETAEVDADEAKEELKETDNQPKLFWEEFLKGLRLDDPEQLIPSAPKTRHIWFVFPWSNDIWLTAYVAKSASEVGVMLRLRGSTGGEVYEQFLSSKSEIEQELSIAVSWKSNDDNFQILSTKKIKNPFSNDERPVAITFLRETVNGFINVFRPRIAAILE